jgi:NADH-quinone oxidoreductase subunit G
LTLEEIGGRGIRWPEREAASAMPRREATPPPGEIAERRGAGDGGHLRLGTYRPIWSSPEVEVSPSLKFLASAQQLELSPEDAQRLSVANGETVDVSQNGTRLTATAAIRTRIPAGTAFLAEGIATDSANTLSESTIEVHKR